MGADLFADGVEGGGVGDGDFGEHLAVELNAGGDEGGDEAVVGDVAQVDGGAEAGDPELAEVALFLATVAIGVDVGFAGEFEGLAVLRAWGGYEAAGAFEDTFTFAGVNYAASYTGHEMVLSREWSQRRLIRLRGPVAWLCGLRACTCFKNPGLRFGSDPALILQYLFGGGCGSSSGGDGFGAGGGGQEALMGGPGGLLGADAHHLAHVLGMPFEEGFALAKVAFGLGGPGAHEVGGFGMAAFEFAGLGDLETLGDALVWLELVAHWILFLDR